MPSTAGIDKIWSEFGERLLHYIRRTVKTDDDAQDVLQNAFAQISKNAHRLDDVENLSGWIFRITRNAIADHYRKEAARSRAIAQVAREELLREEAALGEEHFPEPNNLGREALAQCWEPLLEQLPDRYSEAIELTELGGLSQKDAADKVGISVSGMKSRVQRARTKLKDVLLKCCTVEVDGQDRVIDLSPKSNSGCKGC